MDPYLIFCKMEPRTLNAAYKLYCGKEMENAHKSKYDVEATFEVFNSQMEKYPELSRDINDIHEMFKLKRDDWIDTTGKFKWLGADTVIGFGKNSGASLKKVALENPEFLKWMISRDFPEDAKKIASDALKGVFPQKGGAA